MNKWTITQLTGGTAEQRFHSHSYYDINVFDSTSRYLVGHEMAFAERTPAPQDKVEVGVIDLDGDARWTPVGESRAWSWQQGPMAQWVPASTTLLWNDRENGRFVTRVHDFSSGDTRTLPRPSYAVDPNGQFSMSVNMARLDSLRPGYGYTGGNDALLNKKRPARDGVWRQDLATGDATLVLSLNRAVRFLYSRCTWRQYLGYLRRRYCYWFNHVKLSPDGKRFTVKLRYRRMSGNTGWSDSMGVSLTCGVDGSDLRLLTNATSHVIWLDNETLYLWRRNGFYLYADRAPAGHCVRQIGPGHVERNAHLRYLPGSHARFVYDTPYREEIDLLIHDEDRDRSERIAHFENHRPENGQFRCDLHPCPSPDGSRMVVTSLEDGGRQIYLLSQR